MMRTALIASVDERQIDEAVAGHPLGRLVTPEEVSDAVLFLAQASPHINGVNMLINSGEDMI
jgi:NAD(P)-dependent dehydrogenase (short-subunit alcohol dehydrogenase family)